MRDAENELHRDLNAGDGAPYPGPGLVGAFCQVPSQGEIGALIAVTAAVNLALARRPGVRHALTRHGDGTTERRSH
ncbi:hypothetical protein ACIRPX_20805 [Streptomyces sp. NPDC101225]|uniref:hypothetical protein n=1 Tax=Streptomyces sp. NPDC101225 TaxID=3366135 RepID=UPI0037F54EC8